MKKVLIACEESQTVCKAFRARGHEAYSCDIQEPSGGHPEWHIKGDVLPILNGGSFTTEGGCDVTIDKWDLIIAHPPCTYISNAGACRLYPKKGQLDYKRYADGLKAKLFFMAFWYYGYFKCGKIAIENPLPSSVYEMPQKSQVIQPYEFGEPYTKKTYLWLFGLPPLIPTLVCGERKPYLPSGTSRYAGANKNKNTVHGSKMRSKTFVGIAEAMAEQWGNYIMESEEDNGADTQE